MLVTFTRDHIATCPAIELYNRYLNMVTKLAPTAIATTFPRNNRLSYRYVISEV